MLNKKVKEYILCAAIWFNDGKNYIHQPKNIKEGFVLTGRRHHNCIGTLVIMNKKITDFVVKGNRNYIQGFITSEDRFVYRKEGGKVAYEAGQIDKENDYLFSEDLY